MAEDERAGWQRLAVFAGGTLTGTALAWFITWGSIVASTDPPQSRPFLIGVTWIATAALIVGLILVGLGELGPPNRRRRAGNLKVTGIESRLYQLATVTAPKPEVVPIRHKRPPRGWAAGVANESDAWAIDVEYTVHKTDGTQRTGGVPLLAGTRDEMGRTREPPEAVTEMGEMPEDFRTWWQELDHITIRFSDAERQARWERRYDLGDGGAMSLAYERQIPL